MTFCTAKALRGVLLCGALCGPVSAHADYASEVARLKSGAAKDATLFNMQAGVAALVENRLPEAQAQFDAALGVIEAMFADTQAAANARSLWYEEGAKEFKGEPYERAMAFYYRGLLYLAEADYENARASFRSGLMQDAFAEEQQNRSDFASLMLLEGWTNQLLGAAGQAKDAYAEAARTRPDAAPFEPGANLLVVAELGGSPRKVGDGIGNHEIRYFAPKRTPERQVRIDIGGKPVATVLAEDLLYQASTRGGRAIDRIIAGKASFKETSGNIGRALTEIGSEASVLKAGMGVNGGGNALGGIVAIGALASVISANVQPRADVRYWNNLSETVHLGAVRHTGRADQIKVSFLDAAGNPVQPEKTVVHQWLDKNGNGIIWIKTRP